MELTNKKAIHLSSIKSSKLNSIFSQIFRNKIFILYIIFWSIRFINIDQPIFDGAAYRQVVTSSVVRFLFTEGISLDNILHPKEYRDNYDSYFVSEIPIYNALVALICKIYGSYEEWIGRFISILLSGLAGFYFYRLLINYTSQRIAKIALIVYCFSPLSIIYTRAIQPNPSMLFFLMATIYHFDKYLREPKWKAYYLAIFSGMILFLLNAAMQTIGILFLYLSIRKYGVRVFSNYKIYFMAICMLIPCWLWIIHANIFLENNLNNVTFGPMYKDILPFSSFSSLSDYGFYKLHFELLTGQILTPIGFGLFVLGLGLLWKEDLLLIFWLISFVIFWILINTGMMHPYYYLPCLFPVAWTIANSISFIYDNLPVNSIYRKKSGLLVLTFFTAGIIAGYSNSAFITPNSVKMVPAAVESLNKYFPKNVFGVISPSNVNVLGYHVDRKVKVLEGNLPLEKKQNFIKILKYNKPEFYLSIYPDEDYTNRNEFSTFLKKNYPITELKNNKFVLYTIK